MCGIVGYIGTRQAQPILIKGLEKLEYRGYDSAGISVMDNGKISVRKVKGKLENLKRLLEEAPCGGTIGIGHTRWATHGEPLDVNSHPHLDMAGEIAVVHNGIIENYIELKEMADQREALRICVSDRHGGCSAYAERLLRRRYAQYNYKSFAEA